MKIIDRKYLDTNTKTCHASTIVFYHNKPVFSWFGGEREGLSDSSIYIQCNGKVHKMEHIDPFPRWNPILFTHKESLYLFVKIGKFCDSWQTLIYDISNIFSSDFDITKIRFQMLPAGLNGPVKTKPIVDEKGLIYCGSSVETIMDWTSYIETYKIKKGQFIFQDRSDPLTVPKKAYVDIYYGKRQTVGIIQPSLWFGHDGNPNAFFRAARGLGKVYSSSHKHGKWTEPAETRFLNPNSGLDTVFYNGQLYLVYNPSDISRKPLVIEQIEKGSTLDTLTIRESVDKADVTHSEELSYPYMIENEGQLHLTYTYGRSKIEYVTVGI